jgi:hypothetical protein
MYEAMHSGAWLPVWAWAEDDPAWDRLIGWINENCHNAPGRLIVTPKLGNPLNNHAGLRRIEGGTRQDEQGRGPGSNWVPGSGPIIIVWPLERTVQRCVQMVAGLDPQQSIILLEQAVNDAPSFEGWATAVGAFDASTGGNRNPDPQLTEQLDHIFTWYENELTQPPRAGALRDKLREVRAAGYDQDFIVTYAIAMGYGGNLTNLRQHYHAARRS